ncbi:hypothetical protein P8452_54120 [Trifolium repens]|jgi:hypothetical protein|nr:hypothetical protein P8452_54120 [Trifolium repens]
MTLKSFASLVFNLIGLEDSQTNKDATIPSYTVATSIDQKKINQSTINNDVGLCCVSLSMLNNKDEIRVLPCLHEFHEVSVNSWLNGHKKTCPLCRFSVGAEEKSHHAEMFSDEILIWFSSFHITGM